MCDLCELVKAVLRGEELETKFHYKNGICIVVHCRTCRVPMVVYRDHQANPMPVIKDHIREIGLKLFPDKRVDDSMKANPWHYHIHMRPKKKR